MQPSTALWHFCPRAIRFHASLYMVVALGLVCVSANADVINLSTWTAESYPRVNGFGGADWVLSADELFVTQVVNGQPSVYYSDFTAMGADVILRITVETTGDDDYIGFVLGFNPGDSSNPAADYLLVDWKQVDQFYDFTGGDADNTSGSTANQGLAVSRVSGIPTADEFWGHVDDAGDAGGGLEELARGATLGETGWSDNTLHMFEFVFSPFDLQVTVDGNLELDVAGAFSNGRLGFYNFSQDPVEYSAVPEPATIALLGFGVAGVAFGRRRKTR